MFCLVLQIFHGADNDVLWLQRDFHIYVVNMFDTAKVSSCIPGRVSMILQILMQPVNRVCLVVLPCIFLLAQPIICHSLLKALEVK